MKESKHKRTIEPNPGSKAKPRDGMVWVTKRTAETTEDTLELLKPTAPTSARGALKCIINNTNQFLRCEDLASQDPDTEEKDRFRPEDYASPEWLANLARQNARAALSMLDAGNTDQATLLAMFAAMYEQKAYYTSQWEPYVAKARAQTPEPHKTYDKHPWATELADQLVNENDFECFQEAWESIPIDDPEHQTADYRCLGFEIYRNGDDKKLIAYPPQGEKKTLNKVSFKKNYFNPLIK